MLVGAHQFKAGLDLNYIDHRTQRCRCTSAAGTSSRRIAAARPRLGLPRSPISAIQARRARAPGALRAGLRRRRARSYGYRISRCSCRTTGESRPAAHAQARPAVSGSVLAAMSATTSPATRTRTRSRATATTSRRGWRSRGIPPATTRRPSTASYGRLLRQPHHRRSSGITQGINGDATGVRTLVARPADARSPRGTRRATRCRSRRAGRIPSLVISIDPGLETPYAHHVVGRRRPRAAGEFACRRTSSTCAASSSSARSTTTRSCPSLGAGRRPADVNGVPGTSASVLQYTSFGRDVVSRPHGVG